MEYPSSGCLGATGLDSHRCPLRPLLVASEKPSARPSLLNETRQMEDRLGLTPMAMLRLRWEVDSATPAPVTPIAERPRRRLIVSEEGDEH
jgi:hypothetical protein